MIEYGYTGEAILTTLKQIVKIVKWSRPYGIPYARLEDGREVHVTELSSL